MPSNLSELLIENVAFFAALDDNQKNNYLKTELKTFYKMLELPELELL